MKFVHEKPVRLMVHQGIDGPLSMAMDRVLQDGIRYNREAQAILRFHTFNPGMLTYGADNQHHVHDLDLDRIRADGLPLVMRPSTGSVSLNTEQELCFTFMTRKEHWDTFGIVNMFEWFNRRLVSGLSELGIDAYILEDLEEHDRRVVDHFDVVNARKAKLVGSGLYTSVTIYSQQGVIPLTPNYRSAEKYFKPDTHRAQEFFCSHKGSAVPSSLSEELGHVPNVETVLDEIVNSMGWSLPFEQSEFTEEEVNLARSLKMKEFRNRAA